MHVMIVYKNIGVDAGLIESCEPTDHWLTNPVGFKILRFNAHAIIIKIYCEVIDFHKLC